MMSTEGLHWMILPAHNLANVISKLRRLAEASAAELCENERSNAEGPLQRHLDASKSALTTTTKI